MQHKRGHRAATNDLDAKIYERQEEGENPARGDRVEEDAARRAAAAAAIVDVLVLVLELQMRIAWSARRALAARHRAASRSHLRVELARGRLRAEV